MSGLILITGGTGQIGKPVVDALLQQGYQILAVTRDAKRVRSRAELPDDAELVEADLSSESGVERLCAEVSAFENLTGYVHAARDRKNLTGPRPSRAQWLDEYWLATVVPFLVATSVVSKTSLQSVVVVGSIYGLGAQRPNLYDSENSLNPHYGAARSATLQVVRDLAVRLAPRTRVNCVSYGGVQGRSDDDFVRHYSAHTPAKRMLISEDLAGPVRFLLSDESSGMTGHNLVVDGGWTAW